MKSTVASGPSFAEAGALALALFLAGSAPAFGQGAAGVSLLPSSSTSSAPSEAPPGASSSAQGNWSSSVNELLNSPGLNDEVERQKHQNALTATSVKVDKFLHSDAVAPKLGEIMGELRFGNHNIVSPDGERVIWMIRSLVGASPAAREATLQKLVDSAGQHVPEAVNFIGFIKDYGLFGMHQDSGQAVKFYSAAARAGYQPALYNLAVLAAYGRTGRADFARAAGYLRDAAAVAPDSSGRVCGLGAFVEFRQGHQDAALDFSKGCNSALAALPQSSADTGPVTPQRIEALRKSIATGANDGFALLESAAARNASTDRQFAWCKYTLLNRYRVRDTATLHDDAVRCFDLTAARLPRGAVPPAGKTFVVASISGFVPTELAALRALRASNKFRYSMTVPYLPFPQQDVNVFSPLLPQ